MNTNDSLSQHSANPPESWPRVIACAALSVLAFLVCMGVLMLAC